MDSTIDAATFDAVQQALRARNAKVTPPRVVSGPILLTGIATRASCGGGMTLRTGKSGRYRYYACAASAQKGFAACKGRSLPMGKLDDAVTTSIVANLLTPERVEVLLTGLMKRQTARDADHSRRLVALNEKYSETEGKLRRLYAAIENDIVDPSDETLKGRMAALKTDRDVAKAALDRARDELRPEARITDEKITAFTKVMRENVLSGTVPFRRAYIRAVVDQVEVDDTEIRIRGRRTVLERLVMGSGAAPAGVPSFVPKWRALMARFRTSFSRSWPIGTPILSIGDRRIDRCRHVPDRHLQS